MSSVSSRISTFFSTQGKWRIDVPVRIKQNSQNLVLVSRKVYLPTFASAADAVNLVLLWSLVYDTLRVRSSV